MLSTAPSLRTAAISCRLQPTLLISSSFHTSPPALRAPDSTSIRQRQPQQPLSKHNASPIRSTLKPSARLASTTSQATQTPSQDPKDLQPLTWNTFFTLRKIRRRYQLGTSILTSGTSFVSGAEILTRSDIDSLTSLFPLDPFITLGVITFLCGGVGWLLGPVVGTSVFNLRNRGVRAQMEGKEREFYGRVRRFRVDPSASSAANPVPDYYGEKIGSVAGYRQWLKDQRAFNRKRKNYF